MTARGLRNLNPGNIVDGTWAKRQPGYTGSDGHFATFATPDAGLQALGALLVTYQDDHGLNTIRGIINRWAPPSENDTGAYVNAVSSAIGIGPDEPLDLHSPSVLAPLIGAIVAHENGSQPYSEAQLLAAAGQPAEEPTVASAPPATFPPGPNRVTVPMPILAILSALGPILGTFIPQIAKALKPESVSAAHDAQTAQLILNTIAQAAGVLQPGQDAGMTETAAAVDKMSGDAALVKSVTQAVVNHPQIMPLLEVGGGVKQARADDLTAATTPTFKLTKSAVFVMSLVLIPIIYWLVGSLIAGGMDIPSDWPWYGQLPLKLLGGAWNGESRSGGFNLVVGLILGGICGVYYGISVTQQKREQAASDSSSSSNGATS